MSEWISVDDKLPDDFEEILYFCMNDHGKKTMMMGHREKGYWTHCCMFYSTVTLNKLVTVTHWKPLPEYPQ